MSFALDDTLPVPSPPQKNTVKLTVSSSFCFFAVFRLHFRIPTSTLSAFHCSVNSFPLTTPFYSLPMDRCFCFASAFSFHRVWPNLELLPAAWITYSILNDTSLALPSYPISAPLVLSFFLAFFVSCHGSTRKPEPQYPDWALLVWHSWLQSLLSQSSVTHRSSWLQPSSLIRSYKSFTSHSDRVMGSPLLPADSLWTLT